MMNGYQHLGLDERRQIYQLAATGRSVHQIAASLQRGGLGNLDIEMSGFSA